MKPRCGRCCHSHKQDECLWPTAKRARSVGYAETESSTDSEELNSPSSASRSPKSEVVTRSSTPSLSHLRLADLPPASLPDTVTALSPYERACSRLISSCTNFANSGLSFTALLKISLALQHRVLSREHEFEGSLLLLGFPNLEQHSALLHAWIAAGVAVTSPSTPKWRHQALIHHVHAVEHLRKSIQAGTTDCEWQRATMLMLHIFEVRTTLDLYAIMHALTNSGTWTSAPEDARVRMPS